MNLSFFCPLWGSENLAFEAFCERVREAGYDGAEVSRPLNDDQTTEAMVGTLKAFGLKNQADAVAAAIERADHIHVRVGHPEGPQITDPRAPEWKDAMDALLAWRDSIVVPFFCGRGTLDSLRKRHSAVWLTAVATELMSPTCS